MLCTFIHFDNSEVKSISSKLQQQLRSLNEQVKAPEVVVVVFYTKLAQFYLLLLAIDERIRVGEFHLKRNSRRKSERLVKQPNHQSFTKLMFLFLSSCLIPIKCFRSNAGTHLSIRGTKKHVNDHTFIN